MLYFSIIGSLCFIPLAIVYIWWWKSLLKDIPTLRPIFPLGHLWYLIHKPNIPNFSILSHLYNCLLGANNVITDGIFYFRIVFYNAVFLTSPETAQEFFSYASEIRKSDFYDPMLRVLGDGLVSTKNYQLHKVHRKVVVRSFTTKMVDRFQPVFSRQASILCEVLSLKDKDRPINISKLITRCTFDVLFETLSGKNINVQKQVPKMDIIKLTEELEADLIERTFMVWKKNKIVKRLWPSEAKYENKIMSINGFYREVVKEREELVAEELVRLATGEEFQGCDERPCFIDLLLQQQLKKEKFFSEQQVLDEIKTLLSAGFDTTANSLKWIFFIIGNYPIVQENIHNELDEIFGEERDRDITTEDLNSMKYLVMVIKESQRLHPPIPIIGRNLFNDVQIGNRKIPKSTEVAMFIGGIHKDPRHFKNPEEFIPERFLPDNCINRHPFAYIPFSAGQRNCPGTTYAYRSMLTILGSVLRKFSIKSVHKRDQVSTYWAINGMPDKDIELYIRQR